MVFSPEVAVGLVDLTARWMLALGITVPFLRRTGLDFSFFKVWRWRLPPLPRIARIAAVSALFFAAASLALPRLDVAVQSFGAGINHPVVTQEHPQAVLMRFSPALLLAVTLPLAAVEEWFFRRELMGGMVRAGGSKWLALLISSVAFGAVHLLNPGTGWLALVTPFFAGLLFGGAYLLGGVQSSCAVHLAYNAAVVLRWL